MCLEWYVYMVRRNTIFFSTATDLKSPLYICVVFLRVVPFANICIDYFISSLVIISQPSALIWEILFFDLTVELTFWYQSEIRCQKGFWSGLLTCPTKILRRWLNRSRLWYSHRLFFKFVNKIFYCEFLKRLNACEIISPFRFLGLGQRKTIDLEGKINI
jgi:hypothetical protein